jgi:hypothetical protein
MHFLTQRLTLPGNSGTISGPTGLNVLQDKGGNITIGSILSRAIPLVLVFAGVGLLIMILISGFSFLTSAGDSKKLESGRNQLTYAIVGFIIIFSAFWFVEFFGTVFGLQPVLNILK